METVGGRAGEAGGSAAQMAIQEKPWLAVVSRAAGFVAVVTPEVTKLLMACYMSAERGIRIDWEPEGLDEFVPAVVRGTWKG